MAAVVGRLLGSELRATLAGETLPVAFCGEALTQELMDKSWAGSAVATEYHSANVLQLQRFERGCKTLF